VVYAGVGFVIERGVGGLDGSMLGGVEMESLGED